MRVPSVFICVLLFLLSGCFPHVYHLPKTDPGANHFPPLPDRLSTLIGIALSGGGSRAAYFGAAGLEALAHLRVDPNQTSILEQVSYISSVSGGSVAASYYATRKPPAAVSVLNPDGSLSSEYQNFFDQYRRVMATNYQRSVELRQFFKVRWFNSNQRATSLAEVLSNSFLGSETLESFYEREKRGDSPRLILNSTLYNNGRRVVMTTVPQEDFRYNFISKLQEELLKKSPHPKPLPESLSKAREALTPLTFQNEDADPRKIPLAHAVAASASFPFFVGPITIQIDGEDTYLHAGDGGLFDNQGTESLVQLCLKKIDDKKAKRALVIAFDSSFPFWVKNDVLDHIENGFDIFVKDSGRIVGIMEQRANAYQAMVWHILQSQGIVLPSDSIIKIIVLRHTEDVWPTDWRAAVPEACEAEGAVFNKREDVMQRLALVPTLFKLTSECDKALLRAAAEHAVEKRKTEIIQFLQENDDTGSV
jgi:predicted acylesterase/phospholipase RssA